MRYIVYGILYFLALIILGFSMGFIFEITTNSSDPEKDKAIFIENCVKQGKDKELCLDNFYGFPGRND